MEDKVTIDRTTFKALASDTRVSLLKRLGQRRKTASELAKEERISVQAASEHLEKLAGAQLINRRDDEGRKWVYYELTDKGKQLIEPSQQRNVWVLLGLSLLALALATAGPVMNKYISSPISLGNGFGTGSSQPGITSDISPQVAPLLGAGGKGLQSSQAQPTLSPSAQGQQNEPNPSAEAPPGPMMISAPRQASQEIGGPNGSAKTAGVMAVTANATVETTNASRGNAGAVPSAPSQPPQGIASQSLGNGISTGAGTGGAADSSQQVANSLEPPAMASNAPSAVKAAYNPSGLETALLIAASMGILYVSFKLLKHRQEQGIALAALLAIYLILVFAV